MINNWLFNRLWHDGCNDIKAKRTKGEKIMEWNEAKELAEKTSNWPTNITEWEKSEYIRLQTEVYFNENNHINSSYCEWAKDAKFAIIAECMYRSQKVTENVTLGN
jgi:hypothetical protein